MSEFDFSDADAEFENAKPAERKNVPDGKYVSVIDRAQLKKSKEKIVDGKSRGGQPMLSLTFKVAEGEHAGRLLFWNAMLVTKENFAWLKKDLETLELQNKIKKLSDLEPNLGEFLDIKCEVTVKSRGENVNIYINKRLGTLDSASIAGPAGGEQVGAGPGGAGAGGAGGPSGDDLPF